MHAITHDLTNFMVNWDQSKSAEFTKNVCPQAVLYIEQELKSAENQSVDRIVIDSIVTSLCNVYRNAGSKTGFNKPGKTCTK